MLVLDKLISDFSLMPNITLGKELNVQELDNLHLVQEQDGNIPAIYILTHDQFKVELNVINKIVYGFVIRLDMHPESLFNIKAGNNAFLISFETNFIDFISFLNENNIVWAINERESMEQRVVISVNYKLDFFFLLDKEDWGLFRVSLADIELYESFL